MARLTIHGFDELENRLKSISSGLRGVAMQNMLYAGADVLIGAWEQSIQSHNHVLTGAMMNNVGKTGINVGANGLEISVYPQGTDAHRITNAQKAYILHYGRNPTSKGTKAIKGDKFVTEAEKTAKPQVYAAMQKALDEYIAGK